VTGTPPKFCDLGDVGCNCRAELASSRCDHPYECNSIGYCVRPACPAGSPGCLAADGTCKTADLEVVDGYCQYKPNCTPGALGCVCDAKSACGSDGKCLDGVCLRAKETMTSVCPLGEAGCDCSTEGQCNGGSTCDSTGNCLFKSCTAGKAGCQCGASAVGKKCDDGFACSDKGFCIVSTCVAGSAGCKCLAGKKCGVKGYTCVELTRDGAENACVGQDPCPGGQESRCIAECGPGNVAVCGKCTYSRPICRDPTPQFCNPNSYLYGVGPCNPSSASTFAVSLVAALLAALAMF